MSLKIIKTSDGSDTIYNSELNETYHSLHGSINESKIVYIRNGLEHYLNKNRKNKKAKSSRQRLSSPSVTMTSDFEHNEAQRMSNHTWVHDTSNPSKINRE